MLEPDELRARVARRARELGARRARRERLRGQGLPRLAERQLSVNVAPARAPTDVERAAVRLGDRARDEEAEPGARLRRPPSARPNFSKISACWSRRDARAAVADRDEHVAVHSR